MTEFNNSNFIKSYLELSLGNQVKNKIVSDNKYIRWVFPYDVLYFIKNLQNPIDFFKPNRDTCYINFTYSNFFRSLKFILLTYFNLEKVKNLFSND